MKIAVFYSGFIRTWDHCRKNQEDNFYTPETDAFFYTYEKPHEGVNNFTEISAIYYPDFIDLYKENMNPITNGVHNALCQWHNLFLSFCLLPTGYDIYIKSRCDIKLSGKIDFSQYEINDTNIYIPDGNDHFGGVNDQFAFGSYEVMKKYCSVYLEHGNLFAKGLTFHTELFVYENLKAKGVNIIRLPITSEIIR